MCLVSGSESACSSQVTYTSLTMTLCHVVIAMAICASRMYRGLVNSDAFNGPPMGVIDAKITTRIWLSSPSTPSCFAEGADTVVDEGLAFRTA